MGGWEENILLWVDCVTGNFAQAERWINSTEYQQILDLNVLKFIKKLASAVGPRCKQTPQIISKSTS